MEKARQHSALAALLLLLSACGAEPPAETAKAVAPVPYAGPPTTYGKEGGPPPTAATHKWAYNGEGSHLLARGAPDSDVLDVVFRCEPSAPGVQYGFFQAGTPPTAIKVASGEATSDYPVTPAAPDFSVSDAWTLSGNVPMGDPAFNAFLGSGRLTRWYGDDPHAWDAKSEEEREAIRTFAAACKGKF